MIKVNEIKQKTKKRTIKTVQ